MKKSRWTTKGMMFGGEVKEPKLTGSMDVDGTRMKLFERPVKLGKRVAVIDAKTAKEIGFVDGEKVFDLLNGDGRYQGYEDPATGEFMLAYTSEGVESLAIESQTDNFMEFLRVIEDNVETAMGADDPKKLRLGVSYERRGKKYVMYIHVRSLKDVSKYLTKEVKKALRVKDDGAGVTSRLVEMVRQKVKAERR